MTPEEVRMLIARVIQESGVGRAQIARDAGLSTASLNAWTGQGKAQRNPQPESLRQLAAGLRRRRDVLDALADELEQAAEE
jgi:hypothetical protein